MAEHNQEPLTWERVLQDAIRERDDIRKRMRKLSAVIREIRKRIDNGECLEDLLFRPRKGELSKHEIVKQFLIR